MHISETRIMQIQRMVAKEFSIKDAIAVHAALTVIGSFEVCESHGEFGREALKDMQDEYHSALEESKR